MADITSGWFALGGALLGGAISQITPIISTVSKSRGTETEGGAGGGRRKSREAAPAV